jgi:hypothetical protein
MALARTEKQVPQPQAAQERTLRVGMTSFTMNPNLKWKLHYGPLRKAGATTL